MRTWPQLNFKENLPLMFKSIPLPKILVLVTFAIALVLGAVACTKKSTDAGSTQSSTGAAATLVKEDLKVGTGAEAVAGKRVKVNYTGTLTNGTKFDSSVDRGVPFEFDLGKGLVIQGWEQGLLGMKVGGKRKLTIPPEMGYGERGAGGVIPPNATLIFEIELLGVQ